MNDNLILEEKKVLKKDLKLNNGYTIPKIGLGTLAVNNVSDIVYSSIKNGLRLIDTALRYKNEKEVGEGINKAINDGIVKREELFILTKLWFHQKHDPGLALTNQLKSLNLTYVDLYLDHFPFSINDANGDGIYVKTPLYKLWKNMEDLVKKGLTKSIGMSNYNVQLLSNLLSFCVIKPVVNEIELHPYFTQENLVNFCQDNDIHVIAYNSLCKGPYVFKYGNENSNLNLFEESVIIELSLKYKCTIGQILLNWAITKGIIVVPASSNVDRIKENLNSINFNLSEEDVILISKLNKNYRFNSNLNYIEAYRIDYDIFA